MTQLIFPVHGYAVLRVHKRARISGMTNGYYIFAEHIPYNIETVIAVKNASPILLSSRLAHHLARLVNSYWNPVVNRASHCLMGYVLG